MKQVVGRLSYIAVALLVCACLSGCGGGGGGGGGPTIKGVANINSQSEKPKVAIMDMVGGDFFTRTSTSLRRPKYGWEDIEFSISLPKTSQLTVYTVAAYNDLNNNNRYETDELLGFADGFIVYDPSSRKWQEWDDYGNLTKYDILADNNYRIYIDAEFTRVPKVSPFDKQQGLKQLQQKGNAL